MEPSESTTEADLQGDGSTIHPSESTTEADLQGDGSTIHPVESITEADLHGDGPTTEPSESTAEADLQGDGSTTVRCTAEHLGGAQPMTSTSPTTQTTTLPTTQATTVLDADAFSRELFGQNLRPVRMPEESCAALRSATGVALLCLMAGILF